MKIDNPEQYIGKKYGKTTVLRYIGRYFNGECKFECKCDCGSIFDIVLYDKKSKVRTSCYSCTCKEIGKLNTKIYVECDGKNYSIQELANELGISQDGVRYRIKNWDKSRWKQPKGG